MPEVRQDHQGRLTSPNPRGADGRGRPVGLARAAGLLCACVLAGAGAAASPAQEHAAGAGSGASDRAETGAPLDLREAHLRQAGDRLELRLAIRPGWSAGNLAPGPAATQSYLCLKLRRRPSIRTLCVVPGDGRAPLALGRPLRQGHAFAEVRSAVVRRTAPGAVTASFRFAPLLSAGTVGWRMTSRWTKGPCTPVASGGPGACLDLLPDQRWLSLRVRDPIPVGCRVPGPSLRSHGSRNRRLVGLTLDDGPSSYTPRVLRILRRFDAHATFFQIGEQVPGGGRSLERGLLRDGNELGAHTQHHVLFPGYGEIAAAKRAIRRVSDFTPCLFRPPGGGVSASVIAAASANKMKTIMWDVDPQDWSLPGTGAIISGVLGNVSRGSIILLHDGGGPRAQTVAALPAILRGLRKRHLKPVTVTQLLKGRFIYR